MGGVDVDGGKEPLPTLGTFTVMLTGNHIGKSGPRSGQRRRPNSTGS